MMRPEIHDRRGLPPVGRRTARASMTSPVRASSYARPGRGGRTTKQVSDFVSIGARPHSSAGTMRIRHGLGGAAPNLRSAPPSHGANRQAQRPSVGNALHGAAGNGISAVRAMAAAPSPVQVPETSQPQSNAFSEQSCVGGGTKPITAVPREVEQRATAAAAVRPSTTPDGAMRRRRTMAADAAGTQVGGSLEQQNAKLREEVVQLKEMLLNGLRGQKRFISGGQFRTRKSAGGTSHGLSASERNNEASLKQMLRQARSELADARAAARAADEALRRRIEEEAGLVAQLKEGANRHGEVARALKAAQQQASRDETKALWLKEQLATKERQLESQLQRGRGLEEQISSMTLDLQRLKSAATKSRTAPPASFGTSKEDELRAEVHKLRDANAAALLETQAARAGCAQAEAHSAKAAKRVEMLEDELAKIKKDLTNHAELQSNVLADKNAHDAAMAELRERIRQLELELAASLKQTDAVRGELECAEKRESLAKAELVELRQRCVELSSAMDRELERGSAAAGGEARMREALSAARSEAELQRQRAEKAESSASQACTTASQLRVKVQDLEKAALEHESKIQRVVAAEACSVDELQKLRRELAAEQAARAAAETSVNSLRERDAKRTALEESLRSELESRRVELAECQRWASPSALSSGRSSSHARAQTAPGRARGRRASAPAAPKLETPEVGVAVKSVEGCIKRFQAKLSDLSDRNAELQRRASTSEEQIKDQRKKAAEMIKRVQAEALETTLQSLVRLCVVAPTVNVHLGGNETMDCHAPMPHKVIRGIIEDDILPRFSKVFVQPDEGLAPDGVDKLDTWLESMLGEMQSSIEKHLQELF